MKAVEANLLSLLRSSPQFSIPIYQRTYSWDQVQCAQLWGDVLRAGEDDRVPAHFLGSVVYIQDGLYQVSNQGPVLVIDGQQRLTTVTLLLEALARRLDETDGDEPEDGFSARKIRNYYLVNPEETGDRHFKLLLTQTDRDSLLALVQQKPLPEDGSMRVADNFAFFTAQIARLNDLRPLCRGLAKLVVVDVSLNRAHDNPQLIFESMNSTGRELSQADLIRNFVLMGLEPAHQTALYTDHWRPMERLFGQEAYDRRFDGFMRNYLTVRTGSIPRQDEVYEAFKAHARSPEVAEAGVDTLVAEVHRYARFFCAIALEKEPDPQLADAFRDLHQLRVDVAYPFLMALYADYDAGLLGRDELLEAVRLVEAYVFRRAVCSIPTNSLNKTFATFHRALRKDRYLESIRAHFLLLPSYRRFPADEEFEREIQHRDLYNFRSKSYWLRRMENHGRKERVPVEEYTVEHILPQNEALSAAWRADLGPDWKQVQQRWLHTLGNLTLTGYNSEYRDRPFAEKRDMEGGFRHSPLRLNEGLGQLDAWTEDTIRARAERLARRALAVWPAPGVSEETLDTYRPRPKTSAAYGIEDHPYLVTGAMREVFEAFSREVVQLDPCVSEEFLKLYVAYKAESNFVDVVPQAKRLVLSLSIDLPELVDPRGLARDVTGLGRWGTGSVEVPLASVEEVPYAVGLVRQALERQLADAEESG